MDYKTIIIDICIWSAEEDADNVEESDCIGIDGSKLCKKSEIQEAYNSLKGMKLTEIILNYYSLIRQELGFIGVEYDDDDIFDEWYDEKLPQFDKTKKISKIISAIDDNRDLILEFLRMNPKKYCSA